MASFHGQFVWCELMTDDAAAAAEFYCSVVGWRARDAGPPHVGYTILNAGEIGAAGLAALPQAARDSGARPGWIGYIAVDDVDAFAARVKDSGGSVHRAPDDIPEVGRFAVVGDPQGAIFTLFRPRGGETPPALACATPGRVGWRELHAADGESAFSFYADLFGWTKREAFEMGPMGLYQTFATDPGPDSPMVGGIMTRTDATRRPGWLYYFNIDEIDAAVARARQAGGQLLHGPQEVPGGSWIAQFLDPQGAMFAIVGPRG